MANTKSAIKNVRKSARLTAHNRSIKSRLRTLARNLSRLVETGASDEEKKAAAIKYVSALDKAAKTKVIHSNIANHRKSACAKFIFGKTAATTEKPVEKEEEPKEPEAESGAEEPKSED